MKRVSRIIPRYLVCVLGCLLVGGGLRADDPISVADVKRTNSVDFESEILPVLKNNCLACHNQTKAKAGLILETPQSIQKGGDSGPAVVPGKSGESLLLKVASHREDPHMPPKDNKVNAADLKPEELGLLKLWIDQGAKGEVHGTGPIQWQPLPQGLNPIYAVAITPDGQFSACSRANQIFVYHVPSGQLATRLVDLGTGSGIAHRDFVESLAFSPDGNVVASGSFREVKLWRRLPYVHTNFFAGTNIAGIKSVAVSPDSIWVAVGLTNGEVHLWNAKSNAFVQKLGTNATALKFSPDSGKLASASEQTLQIWEIASATNLITTNLGAAIKAVAWVGTNQVAMGDADGVIRLLETTSNALKELKGHTGAVTCIEALGDNRLLSGGADGNVFQWDVAKGEIARKLKHEGVTALAVRKDGKRFASAGADKVVRLWNIDDGKEIAALKGDRYAIEKVAAIERDLTFASSEINYRKSALENSQKQQKTETERLAKVTESLKTAQNAFDEKQKALAEAKTTKDAAEKILADLNAELKKVTDQFTEAEKLSKEATAKAKSAVEKATAAKLAAEQAAQTKLEVEKVAADAAAVVAKTRASSQRENSESKTPAEAKAASEKMLADAESVAAKAKSFAESVATDAAAKLKAAIDAQAAAEKAIDEVALRAGTAGQLKPAYEKITAESPEKIKKATEKFGETTNALAKVEKEFNRAEIVRANADHEVMLVKTALKAADDTQVAAKSALENAEASKKKTEQQLDAANKDAADSERLVRSLAFSPDNRTLASAGDDRAVHTWNAENGLPFEIYRGHSAPLNALLFTGTNSLLSLGEELTAWDLRPQWQLERTLGTGDERSPIVNRVMALDFSPDGQRLATGGGEPTRGGEIKIWNLGDGKLLQDFTNVHSDAVFALDFSPDGKYLASGAADKFVRVVELTTGKIARAFEGHTHHVLGVSWKRDGRTLASAGADNVVKVWDFVSGERKKNIEGFGKEVTTVSFVGVTDQMAVAAGDAQLKLVKDNGDSVRSFSEVSDFLHSAAATPDGQWIIAGGQDSVLRIWNGTNGSVLQALGPP